MYLKLPIKIVSSFTVKKKLFIDSYPKLMIGPPETKYQG